MCPTHCAFVLFQSQKGNESDLRSVDFYPGNGTFDLMYYPYYGKLTHVSKDTDAPAAVTSPGKGVGTEVCFWLFWAGAGGRLQALGLQHSISIPGKPEETLRDTPSPFQQRGWSHSAPAAPEQALLGPQSSQQQGVGAGCAGVAWRESPPEPSVTAVPKPLQGGQLAQGS